MKKILIIVAVIVAIVAIWLAVTYNGLVRADQKVSNQWAQVETQYQRRFDLIPNLVESAKGVMKQEQAVFGAIAEARTRYAGATGVNDKVAAANQMESALARLLVVMENYPQLKSAENVQTLMAELAGTENRVSVERKRFNDVTREFNVNIKTIPTNLVAGMFGFAEKKYFEAQQGAENAPKVEF